MGWHEHVDGVFMAARNSSVQAMLRIFVSSWIPALHDVQGKLEAGARVADVGLPVNAPPS